MLRNLVNFGKRLALLKKEREEVDGTLVVEIAQVNQQSDYCFI